MHKNVMVIDCEFNQPSRKLIQLGAAIYSSRNAALVGTLDLYVNPNEPISESITQLTGIRDSDVSSGVSIVEAYRELKHFSEKHKAFKNPMVWGSGERNDSLAIYEEYKNAILNTDDYNIDQPEENFMGRRVLDVKTIYQSVMIFENSQYAGGLKDCMKKLGLTFEGEPHRALTDAQNTFKMWYYLMRTFHDGLKKK